MFFITPSAPLRNSRTRSIRAASEVRLVSIACTEYAMGSAAQTQPSMHFKPLKLNGSAEIEPNFSHI